LTAQHRDFVAQDEISMSLAAAARANNLSQLITVTEINYNSCDHSMIAVKAETPVHDPARSLAGYTPAMPQG
jgi:hypothetical protein